MAEIREIGDAPQITRLLDEQGAEKRDDKERKLYTSSWSNPEKFARRFQEYNSSDCWYDNDVWQECNEHFNGVKDINEAIDLAFNGWKEGGEIIEKTRGYIQALNPLHNRLVKYGIAGAVPSVPRAVAGNILNMRLPDPQKSQKRRTITLVYNMCESCGNEAKAITNKAAVTAALIDEIEAKGFACEVIAVAATHNWKIRCVTSVCVKESHLPVDINRLAFSLGHAAMFRVLFFADWEVDDFCESLGWGLGTVSSTRPTKEQNFENIYTITSGYMNWNKIRIGDFEKMDDAVTKGLNSIVSELQRQGCPAFPKKDHEDDLAEETEEEDDVPEWDY